MIECCFAWNFSNISLRCCVAYSSDSPFDRVISLPTLWIAIAETRHPRVILIKFALSVCCILANVMRVLSTLPSEMWINASCLFIEIYNILLSGMS